MIPAQVIEMLQIQDRLNKMVDPNWLTAQYDWTRAIMVESIEMLDHIGWKWWKKQEPNIEQARLELIDIWHFVLSHELVQAEGSIQKAALSIMEGWEMPATKIAMSDGTENIVPFVSLPLQRRIELFGCLTGMTGDVVVPMVRNIAEDLHLTAAELFEVYMSKNALNIFRQENGYKDGTYIKVWNGREDNEVLAEIIDSSANLTVQALLNKLREAYSEVLATQKV